MAFDDKGREIPDKTPLEMPLGLKKPESMEDMIRRYVRVEASKVARHEGMETFEEADDFDMEDEDDLEDPYSVYYVNEQEMKPENLSGETPESLDGIPAVEAGPESPQPQHQEEVKPDQAPQEQ